MLNIQELTLKLSQATQYHDQHAVVVAGQALAFWGAYYLDGILPEEALIPLASTDIDFYEKRVHQAKIYVNQITELLKQTEVTVKGVQYPEFGDMTIHTALMTLNIPGEEEALIVDFIDHVEGVLDKDFNNQGVDKITIGDGSFWIMNPVLCLKARIHNLVSLYPRLGKSPERMDVEIERVKLAIKIVKEHLKDVLAHDVRKALTRSKVVTGISKRRIARDLLDRHGINILDAIPLEGFPALYYERELPDFQRKLQRIDKLPKDAYSDPC